MGLLPDIGISPGDPTNAAAIHLLIGPTNRMRIIIRTTGDPLALSGPLRRAVNTFSATARIEEMQPLANAGWAARALLQGLGGALLMLGLMALLLSGAGLYAVLSFSITRRTREIGVRVALGATPGSVLRRILPRTTVQVVLGLIIGSAIGFWVLRFTQVLPIAIPESPVLHLVLPAALLLMGALAATLRPTLHALAIRPAEALRIE